MATNYWDTSTSITYRVTKPSSADAIRDLSAGGTQVPGALGAIGSRILPIPDLTSWTISAGTGSGFKVTAGAGIAYDSGHSPPGWAFLWTKSTTDNQTTGLVASLEQFIIASIVYASMVGDPDSRETGTCVFTAQSTPTPPAGGILIGGVTTNGGSVVTSAWSRGVDLNSVRAIATSAITLSGTQTVDGVALAVGDLCAVTGQADQTTNDIYIVSANAWNKAPLNYIGSIWHNGASFWVRLGTASANTRWQLTTADPVTRGSSNIVFSRLDGNFVHLTGNETIAGTKTFSSPPVVGTASPGDNTTNAASTAFVLANRRVPVVEVTGTSQAAAVNTRYIANNAALVTITLPTTAAQGDVVYIVGKGAGGWKLAQNSGQTIHGATDTTTGVGGSLASAARYNVVSVVCVTASTDWTIIDSQGTLTVV